MQVLCVSWCDWSAYVMWPDVAAAHSTQPSLHWTDGEQPFTKYEPLHLHLLKSGQSRESRTRHLLACFWEHICCRSWESTTHLFDMPSSPYKDTVVCCTAIMSIVPFQTSFQCIMIDVCLLRNHTCTQHLLRFCSERGVCGDELAPRVSIASETVSAQCFL